MPTRKALLIASPDITNDLLPGARADVYAYTSFLLSIEGGAWQQSEITQIFNPTRAALLNAVRAMSGTDYAFITFSGHGSHHAGSELYDTSLQLTAHETCYVSEVNPRNNRHFVIIDCCRALVSISEDLQKEAVMANRADNLRITKQHSRDNFDKAFAQADQGRVVAYSCQLNQSAGESPRGGFFSRSMVAEAYTWANTHNADAVHSVNNAFINARIQTYNLNAPQMPELQAGRRLRHYPFAIAANEQPFHG